MTSPYSVLFVDDELLILKSLERLFEDEDFEILTASGALDAIEILKKRSVTVVVSDYRMPEMDGVRFFEEASLLHPDIIRVMLTGYADIEAIVSSINQGQVFRFITKPWVDEDFKKLIQNCFFQYEKLKKNTSLQELNRTQFQELKEVNTQLQKKLEETSRDLQDKIKKIEITQKVMDQSFFESIKLILKIMELHNRKVYDHSRKVSILAENMAKSMGLSPMESRNVQIAALLHDLGKIYLSKEILFKKENLLSHEQKQQLRQHPTLGHSTLAIVDRLKKVSEIILYHHEKMDGSGYPFGKDGGQTPLESRIISVANGFENLTGGMIQDQKTYSTEEAIREIRSLCGVLYDPEVVVHLEKIAPRGG